MISPILSRASTDATAAARYAPLQSSQLFAPLAVASENVCQTPMPDSGTLSQLFVKRNSAPGAGTSVAYTVRKNGVDTALTCTVSGTGTTASDTTNSVSYVAGDLFSVSIVPTGTVTASAVAYTVDNSSTGQCVATGGSVAPSTAGANWLGLQNGDMVTAVPTTNAGVIPTAGVIDRVYLTSTVAAGLAKTWTATLVVNGVDTALVVVITGTTQVINSNLISTVTVAAGDTAYWRIDPSATAPTAAKLKVSARFTPTISGESIQLQSLTTTLTVSTNNFSGVWAPNAASVATTEVSRANYLGTAYDLKKLRVVHSVAPSGAGKSYTSTIYSNGAPTAVTTAVTDTATANNDSTHSAAATIPGNLSVLTVGTGTPTVSALSWGFVTYKVQALAGTTDGASTDIGEVAVAHSLAATSAGAGADTADVSVAHTLAGTSTGAGADVGDLAVAHPLAGASAGAAADTGDVAVSHTLTGTSVGASADTGDATVAVDLAGISVGASTDAGDAAVTHPLAGLSIGVSADIGDVVVTRPLAGASAGVSDDSGGLALELALDGLEDGSGVDAGALIAEFTFAGVSAGASSDAGSMAAAIFLSGQSDGFSADDASLRVLRGLAGLSTGGSADQGELALSLVLIGASAGTSTDAGMLAPVLAFAAISIGGSGDFGELRFIFALDGLSSGLSNDAGNLRVRNTSRTLHESLTSGGSSRLRSSTSGARLQSSDSSNRLALRRN